MIIGSGIFSTPATILGNVGSVGMVLIVFTLGSLVSFFGTFAYCELGTMRPYSGGEKEYLDYAFPSPKAFWPFLFTQSMVFLVRPGFCAADSIAFGQYFMSSIYGPKTTYLEYGDNAFVVDHYDWLVKAFAVMGITLIVLIHSFLPKWGIELQNFLTLVKILVLVMIVIIGIVAASGVFPTSNNFHNAFQDTEMDGNSFASALFASFFAFDGWNNLNYSMDELQNPTKTLPIASLTAIALTSLLYITVTISYFIVIPVEEIDTSLTTLAGQFFTKTLGPVWGGQVINVFIALSCFGCVMCLTFGSSRVTLAATKEGYFPFSKYLAHVSSALLLHWVLVVILILAPPSGSIYEFLINVTGYPEWIFYGISVVGLL